MNKFGWFIFGSVVGGFITKEYIDHANDIDIWLADKFGMESPSKLVFNNDEIKEGIHNAFSKNDIGRDSDGTGASADRISISNIIHSEEYLSDDILPSEDDGTESESIYVVNDENSIRIDPTIDPSKIYKKVVIDKDDRGSEIDSKNVVIVNRQEYLNAIERGLECLSMAYRPSLKLFVVTNDNDSVGKIETQCPIEKLSSYIGQFMANYVKMFIYEDGSINESYWRVGALYIRDMNTNTYYCISIDEENRNE